ncbi:hypothetical protein FRC01_008614 [Tulasnella sp. 417]|nr:hypothetical protein FRC01_008614 [Tulasnella sp. 417]
MFSLPSKFDITPIVLFRIYTAAQVTILKDRRHRSFGDPPHPNHATRLGILWPTAQAKKSARRMILETQARLASLTTPTDLIDEYLQRAWDTRDEFLYSINLKLQALKYQRNLHASIHKLPVELLVYIFRLSLPSPETGADYIENLLTILGVCKHWADVMNAAASLWTAVTSAHGPDFLDFTLTKLGSTYPLHIDCDLSDEEFPRILRQLSPHVHRWETAYIVMPQTEEGRQYLSVPAPKLRRLHLSVPSGTARDEPNSRAFNIFNGSADRLEDVKVAWTCLLWDTPILRGLKSLHLQYCTSIRVSDVISILNNCPDLGTLIIDGTDITVDTQTNPPNPVNMARLEHIKFTVGELEGIQAVINGFNAPNCKTFKFYFGTAVPGDTEPFILTTLAPYFPCFRRMMFDHPKAVIDISDPRKFHIHCPLEKDEEDFLGFNLHFSNTPPAIVMDFLHHVLGEDESPKPDVRLIIGGDRGTEGLSILNEVSSYCNVVDLWLGAYVVHRDFATENTLRFLAHSAVLPYLRHLIVSGHGWDGEELEAILRKRYNQPNRSALPLRIHLIGRGLSANSGLAWRLERLPMIEEVIRRERSHLIENKDV